MTELTLKTILTIYTILVAGMLISMIFIIRRNRKYDKVRQGMISDLVQRGRVLTMQRNREREVGQIFSKALFDLAHTQNAESIQWKLMCIRQTQEALRYSDALMFYDASGHNWLIDILDRAAPSCQREVMEIIRKWTKGYYIMDATSGENLCNIIEKLFEVQVYRKKELRELEREFDEFAGLVASANFNLPMVCKDPPVEEKPRVYTFEELLAEIEAMDLDLSDEEVTSVEEGEESILSEDTAETQHRAEVLVLDGNKQTVAV